VLCNGGNSGTATSSASGGTPPYTYLWNNGQTMAIATGLSAGTYTVTVTDANGCTSVQTVVITQPPAMSSTVSSTPAQCGSNNGTATVTVTGGVLPYTYFWSPSGGTSSNATGLPGGNYTVTVTDANGCTQTVTVSVTSTGGPTATVSASVTVSPGSSTILNASGGGTYLWSPASGLSCITCQNPTASPSATTQYCVIVSDTNNCSDSACLMVYVENPCSGNLNLPVANAFSPNNDGANDRFCLRGWNNCLKDFIIYIYDRWGEKVFESENPAFCWDGTYKGSPLNTGVFVYYIKAILETDDEVVKRGNISLIR
jgi:gliding motility-associated-like protein